MFPKDIFQSEAELKIAEAQEYVALEALKLAQILKKPEPIDVEALRAADLQMVFTEDDQIIFQKRSG